MSWYTLDETAGDYAMANFSIARDREKLIPYIKAALQVRPDIHLWASPWIVPAWMKDSSGNMKSDAQTQGALCALHRQVRGGVRARKASRSRRFTPRTSPATRRSTGRKRCSSTSSRPTWGRRSPNETSPPRSGAGPCRRTRTDTNIAKALANDRRRCSTSRASACSGTCRAAVATLAPKGPVMQTEHKCGNYNFAAPYWDQSRYSANKPQNDHCTARRAGS